MIKSWEKQILGHVNQICNIRMGDAVHSNILIINIDLDRRNIIGRLDKGNGPFISFLNVENFVINDVRNRRPGKDEFIPEML
jgi:hypothetical protein